MWYVINLFIKMILWLVTDITLTHRTHDRPLGYEFIRLLTFITTCHDTYDDVLTV